jgi:hypothetical protein
MIQHPAIVALLLGSALTGLLLLYAGWYGVRILARWDIRSGSELQLELERRTYLISTILNVVLAVQVLSLFLFIFTADRLHNLFVGAMCAAGSLSVNAFGYPTLILKVVTCLLAGVWLVLNHADTRGYDYPLIRVKYAFLLVLIPFVLVEGYLQYRYFAGLQADVITSCCGSLFSQDKHTLAAEIAGLPVRPTEWAFYGSMAATAGAGLWFRARGSGGYLFSFLSLGAFVIAVASLISFIGMYIYELPSHHCPFDILQAEYGYVGYLLYLSLLGGAIAGLGTGALLPFRRHPSLASILPGLLRRLTLLTLVFYAHFVAITLYEVLSSNLKLG